MKWIYTNGIEGTGNRFEKIYFILIIGFLNGTMIGTIFLIRKPTFFAIETDSYII